MQEKWKKKKKSDPLFSISFISIHNMFTACCVTQTSENQKHGNQKKIRGLLQFLVSTVLWDFSEPQNWE